ncbi:MAG: hypothetical protein LKF52_06245 [Butyrivibrio sp.]|nr:hypothetical protein [Butyrivibrio sp.]
MAVSDEIREQHNKVKQMGTRARLAYFWEYYRIPTVVILAVIILAVFLIHDIVTAKPYGFYAMMINSSPQTQESDLEDSFAKYADIDTSKYDCYIDTSTTLNLTSTNQYDMASQQKIMAVVAAGDLDTMVADYNSFNRYAMNDTFTDLRKILTSEQQKKYADDFYYIDYAVIQAAENQDAASAASSEAATTENTSDTAALYTTAAESSVGSADQFVKPDPSSMKDPVPVGIILSDASYLNSTGAYTGTVAILGITQNTSRSDEALRFIDFLNQ